MEDKTPIYLLVIVGIVALVAVVYMLTGTSTSTDLSNGGGITANVVADDIQPVVGAGVIAKILLAALMVGAVLHMYHKW
jgi:hypothetical protein